MVDVSKKPINERYIYFTGSACISEDLADDVCFKVNCSVVKEEYSDNQDGTAEKTFKCKIISAEKIEE